VGRRRFGLRYTPYVSDERDEPIESGASRRRGWVVRKYLLGHEPGDDLSASTTPEERLAMMWPLALDAWSLAGKRIPDYQRRDAPVRIYRSAS